MLQSPQNAVGCETPEAVRTMTEATTSANGGSTRLGSRLFHFITWRVSEELTAGMKGVPAFYSGNLERIDVTWTCLAAAATATMFGAIHDVAWPFQFSSHMEQRLWRVASVCISFVPAGLSVLAVLAVLIVGEMSDLLIAIATILGSGLYLFSRITLLVIAFTSLRSLPSGAYETVHWTTFIPHI